MAIKGDPTFIDKIMRRAGATREEQGLPVDSAKAREWAQILQKYKSGKANLESRVIENQEYWKRLHWREIRPETPDTSADPEPTSAWLTNVILSKHAARMDAFPEATILPREQMDEAEADLLTSVIPCVLDQADFKKTYSGAGWDKAISCGAIYSPVWDQSKHNGLGDIDIRLIDILNIFWEPGITDIQDSKYVFVTALVDTDKLREMYPDKLGDYRSGGKVISVSEYSHEDSINTDEKDVVVDVYYKRIVNGKTVLHYAKFVQDIILYATENEIATDGGEPMAVRGLYDHGKYPFVVETMYPIKNSLFGYGYVDICKDPQKFIDIMGNAILKNTIEAATPRSIFSSSAGINLEEFCDMNKRAIRANGKLGADDFRLIETKPLESNVLNFYQFKIDEMKQTSGNRDAANGGTEGGVTAASALAIMQESGNALSRDENGMAYEAYKEIVKFCVELIRQFYELPRFFRILGQQGAVQYVTYTNANLQLQQSEGLDGTPTYRLPEFDLTVEASKSSPYSAQNQNNLALQFYQMGFFNPMNAPMVLQCLEMMEFTGKDKLQRSIASMAMGGMAMAQPMGVPSATTAGETQNGADRARDAADKKQAQAESATAQGVTP